MTTGPASPGSAGIAELSAGARCRRVLEEIDTVLVGGHRSARLVLLGVLASGHVLIEDVPGVGKTLLARLFATALGLEFTRVQFTPDLLPSDLTGAEVYDPGRAEFTFRRGPIFTNLFLADEINRTPPKTQAALLEAMAERQVTAAGSTIPLPDPFVVLATDNPIEYEGTYPLPEAQLDRFALRVRLGYLSADDETAMVRRRIERADPAMPACRPVISADDVIDLRRAVEQVEIVDDVIGYAGAVVRATRDHPQVELGASPRATLDLVHLARAAAMVDGREYVAPEDIKQLAVPVLAHRLGLRPEAWVRRVDPERVVTEILGSTATPRTGSI